MAGGMYRVIELDPKKVETTEDGESTEVPNILTEVELVKRFAPHFNPDKASEVKQINSWVKAFVASEDFQAGFGVKVEKQDSRQVFEGRLSAFQDLEEKTRDAKKELVEALQSVLSDTTEKQIKEGPIHATSASGATKVGIVEYFVKVSKVPVKEIIEKYADSFPTEVQDELNTLLTKRQEEAAKRTGKS